MRRLLVLLLLLPLLCSAAAADFVPETDYMALMMEAAAAGDAAAGYAAEARRAEKLAAMMPDGVRIAYDDLCLLARIIEAEAGSAWLDMEWKMSVGEVVLNRVASPEFPDTIAAVLAQPGQYYGAHNRWFNALLPSAASVEAAKRLLAGERVLREPSVVFQANLRLGSGVFRELRDALLGSTYLCFSSHRELYLSA
jgi:hypothetical protein